MFSLLQIYETPDDTLDGLMGLHVITITAIPDYRKRNCYMLVVNGYRGGKRSSRKHFELVK